MKYMKLKALGFLEIGIAVFMLLAAIYVYYEPDITIAVPLFIKYLIIYCSLLIASGIGIILRKKVAFMANYYLYTFLCLDEISGFYMSLNATHVGMNEAVIQRHHFYEGFKATIFILFFIGIVTIVSRRTVREYFEIKKSVYLLGHVFAALVIYAVLYFYFPMWHYG